MSGQPIDIRPDHEALVRDILLARLPEGVLVWAFGSRAKWLAKPYSDLDLALEAAEPLPDDLVADLKDEFRESDLPWKVDVLDLNAIAPSFRALIDEDRVGFSLRDKWQYIQLGDLCEVITKGTTPSVKLGGFADGGVNYIKSESLNYDGHIDVSKFAYVSGKTHQKLKRSILQENDVLISIAGANLGKVSMVTDEMLPANTNQAVGIVRVDVSKADPQFIQFYLRNPQFVANNLAGVAQSAQPNLNLGDISRFQIPELPLPEQRAIAAILGSLDDKIDLNRRMNETLEAMARAIFKDWFVDFGPTRAKIEGREPYLAPEIWELFPDRLGGDGLPMGWEEKPLDEIAEFLNGLALQKFPASDGDDYLPVIKIAELRNGISAKTNKASREVPKKYVVKDGDFIFSWSGSLMAKFWTCGEGALNQHLFKVTSKDYPAWLYSQWVFHHLAEFQEIAKSKATTMGHIQRGHLKAAKTICPPADVLERLGAVIGPLVIKAIKNKLESRTLAQTRDLLLPKLMSGEIRLRDAERLVKDTG